MTARTRALAERKDAEEEFFKMLLLACKMNYVKAFPTVMKVDASKLYKDVKGLKKPFFEWPQWIEDTIRRLMLRERYGYRTARQTELQNMAEGTTAILLDPGFRVIANFF